MSAIKIFKMDDSTWYAGDSLESAVAGFVNDCGEGCEIEPRELTDDELDTLKFFDDEPRIPGVHRTFREELARSISAGEKFPRCFACTEY